MFIMFSELSGWLEALLFSRRWRCLSSGSFAGCMWGTLEVMPNHNPFDLGMYHASKRFCSQIQPDPDIGPSIQSQLPPLWHRPLQIFEKQGCTSGSKSSCKPAEHSPEPLLPKRQWSKRLIFRNLEYLKPCRTQLSTIDLC